MGHVIKSETTDEVGKYNLLGGIVIFMYAALATIPPLIVELARFFFDKSDWSVLNPLLVLAGLIVYFLVSLKLIPRKPPIT